MPTTIRLAITSSPRGTGLTLTAPLSKTHLVGPNEAVSTTLAAPAAANATNVKVASVADLASGDNLTVGQPGYTQTVTIQSVGTAGATGTGVTFSPALSNFHYSGDPVIDATSANVSNASGGVSDIEHESLVAAELDSACRRAMPTARWHERRSVCGGCGRINHDHGRDAPNLSVGDHVRWVRAARPRPRRSARSAARP